MRQLKITQSITNRTANVDRLFNDIEKLEMIDPNKEVELAERIKNGDKDAEDQLVKANMRFLISVAKQYHFQDTDLGDLIGDGSMGLIKAAKKFDASKGFKFISYAVWWIRQEIMKGINDHSRMVRLPGNKINKLNPFRKAISDLEQRFQRSPSPEEICEHMQINLDTYTSILNSTSTPLSLDYKINEEESTTLLDVIPDNGIPTDSDTIKENIREQILKALSSLTPLEQRVLKSWSGFEDGIPLSLDEIASRENYSKERVRQIKLKSFSKLRKRINVSLLYSLN